ncbi:MAG TPA: oxygen-independent coproporphyrinogen III oxidase [Bacteroidia bacterium]|nr:oxygen-independent coproporphyrinogen III oxidase [Bacteroidia bacterium]
MKDDIISLLNKYDLPLPRYTSYPTVPYWEKESINNEKWTRAVIDTFKKENGELTIYIHLPFCENLCTFCACNKRITKNHKVEEPYLVSVLKEWEMYRSLLPSEPVIREIHLGGGTPTFFSPENLVKLINGITKNAKVSPNHEFSIEVHPNYTTEAHLAQLATVGFNRISLGVQDFDPTVQFVINRVQSFEKTKEVVQWSRKYGYNSINIDLIYGLPKQTVGSIEFTIAKIKELKPDRIAFYSYAFVPWKSKAQRRYTKADLPEAAEKWKMYQLGKKLLMAQGYKAIGMDHFALPNDKLFDAVSNGTMHRNFMGYTTTQSKLIIALGASSISDAWTAFAQNEEKVEEYQEKISQGLFPLVNGHLLTEEDLIIRKNILDLMCRGKTEVDEKTFDSDEIKNIFDELFLLQKDDLLKIEKNSITVSDKGSLFIRNISSTLDVRLRRKKTEGNMFSKSI